MRGEHKLDPGETDAFSRYWRRRLSYLMTPGVVKKIKRQSHKKDRQVGKKRIDEQRD